MYMAAPLIFKGFPLLRLRLASRLLGPPRLTFCSAAASESTWPEENVSSADKSSTTLLTVKEPPKYHRWDDPDYRKWKDKEAEILRDIEPILFLTKEILHSRRMESGGSCKSKKTDPAWKWGQVDNEPLTWGQVATAAGVYEPTHHTRSKTGGKPSTSNAAHLRRRLINENNDIAETDEEEIAREDLSDGEEEDDALLMDDDDDFSLD